MDRHPGDRVVTFPEPLIRGTIVRRLNRFIIEVDLDGQVVPGGGCRGARHPKSSG